jgi:predicted dehydrogenase
VNIGIVGCGAMGQLRAQNLGGASLVAVADTDTARATELARRVPGCAALSEWQELVNRSDIHAVIVATPNYLQPSILRAAIASGKHVLVEKPGARHFSELRELAELARERSVCVRIGFNLRYHRAMQQARKLIDDGAIGELMFVRARYGHGGRIGYENEWRAHPEFSGGGELLDQGVHLIDLSRWFLGEFVAIDGFAHTYFWRMPVDDNAFLTLRTNNQQVAFLQVSCTEWKNLFSFEVYGRDGKLQIDGLGGSYGTEKLTWYKMLPQMGPPETTVFEYPMSDNSRAVEMAEFLEDIRLRREPAVTIKDAVAALVVVDQVYQSSGYDHRP